MAGVAVSADGVVIALAGAAVTSVSAVVTGASVATGGAMSGPAPLGPPCSAVGGATYPRGVGPGIMKRGPPGSPGVPGRGGRWREAGGVEGRGAPGPEGRPLGAGGRGRLSVGPLGGAVGAAAGRSAGADFWRFRIRRCFSSAICALVGPIPGETGFAEGPVPMGGR